VAAITSSMQVLSLRQGSAQPDNEISKVSFESSMAQSPSHLPRSALSYSSSNSPFRSETPQFTPSSLKSKSRASRSPHKEQFLSRFSNAKAPEWDHVDRLENMEILYGRLRSQMEEVKSERKGLEGYVEAYQTRSKS
jgi:hypothetical protein